MNTLLIKAKGKKSFISKSQMQLQGFSNLFCLSCCSFCLLAVWEHAWNDNMKIEFFYPWIWQEAKAIMLLKHLISHAKFIRNFNDFQKHWKETRKLKFEHNTCSINICYLYSKNKTDFEKCSFAVFFEVRLYVETNIKETSSFFWLFWN